MNVSRGAAPDARHLPGAIRQQGTTAPAAAMGQQSNVPTPPPLPNRPSSGTTDLPPRSTLRPRPPAEPAGAGRQDDAATSPKRDHLLVEEMPLAGYLLARASVGRRVDDADVLTALDEGQLALSAGTQALYKGRGNVADDIATSQGESYVAVQIQRDAVEFLKRSASYEPKPITGRVTPLARNMTRLSACWPADFGRMLQHHFPSQAQADAAVDFITRTVAGYLFGAGNCGEHARVVADARLRLPGAVPPQRIARSEGIDHAWAEALSSADGLRDDDVILDAWMRTPAHLREDSHCASAATETRAELPDGPATAWMRDVIAHVVETADRTGALAALTRPAEVITRDNFERHGATGAEDSVPVNLRPQFLAEAVERSASQSTLTKEIQAAGVARSLGLSVAASTDPALLDAVQQARAELFERDAPTAKEWTTKPIT